MSNFEFPHTRTYDSDLGWLIKCCKTVQDTLKTLEEWKAEVDPEIEDFYKLYQQMINGDLPAGVQEGIRIWLQRNALDLIGDLIHSVFFEITDGGYFIAYIPEAWSDITFNTTEYDYTTPLQPQYGHLVLSY